MRENEYTIQKNIPSSEPIDKAIMKFQFHPSILLIKSKVNASNSFLFTEIKTDDVEPLFFYCLSFHQMIHFFFFSFFFFL